MAEPHQNSVVEINFAMNKHFLHFANHSPYLNDIIIFTSERFSSLTNNLIYKYSSPSRLLRTISNVFCGVQRNALSWDDDDYFSET